MGYEYKQPPSDPKSLPLYIGNELYAVAQALSQPVDSVTYVPQAVAPAKVRDGLTVYANGTNWNPGSGAGMYTYRAGSWRFLG